MLDHIILSVSDLPRSVAFYEQALAPLGIEHYVDFDGENGHPDLKGFGREGNAFFWLKTAIQPPRRFTTHSRPRVGKGSMPFTLPRWRRARVTTSRPEFASSTTRCTTPPTFLIRTDLASRF
jgi:catechol 2,3-dioxygenase-like lactoylglutathione lyase family enzyme